MKVRDDEHHKDMSALKKQNEELKDRLESTLTNKNKQKKKAAK